MSAEQNVQRKFLEDMQCGPCEVYYTNNIQACDRGDYSMHPYQLQKLINESTDEEERKKYKKILEEKEKLPLGFICKQSMGQGFERCWDKRYPVHYMKKDHPKNKNVGPEEDWAFCYAQKNGRDRQTASALTKQRDIIDYVDIAKKQVMLGGEPVHRITFKDLDYSATNQIFCALNTVTSGSVGINSRTPVIRYSTTFNRNKNLILANNSRLQTILDSDYGEISSRDTGIFKYEDQFRKNERNEYYHYLSIKPAKLPLARRIPTTCPNQKVRYDSTKTIMEVAFTEDIVLRPHSTKTLPAHLQGTYEELGNRLVKYQERRDTLVNIIKANREAMQRILASDTKLRDDLKAAYNALAAHRESMGSQAGQMEPKQIMSLMVLVEKLLRAREAGDNPGDDTLPSTANAIGNATNEGVYRATASSIFVDSSDPDISYRFFISYHPTWVLQRQFTQVWMSAAMATKDLPEVVSGGQTLRGQWLEIETTTPLMIRGYNVRAIDDVWNLESGTPQISRMGVTGTQLAPQAWTLLGSLDRRTWVKLDEQTGNTAESWRYPKIYKTFLLQNRPEEAFRYFRFVFTATNNPENAVALSHVSMMGKPQFLEAYGAREFPPAAPWSSVIKNYTFESSSFVTEPKTTKIRTYNPNFITNSAECAFYKGYAYSIGGWKSDAKYRNGSYIGSIVTLVTNAQQFKGEWVQMNAPYNIKVQSYRIRLPGFLPKAPVPASKSAPISFTLLGAELDNENVWKVIDRRENISWTTDTDDKVFNIDPSKIDFYAHYRLVVDKCADSAVRIFDLSFMGVSELETMNGVFTWPAIYVKPPSDIPSSLEDMNQLQATTRHNRTPNVVTLPTQFGANQPQPALHQYMGTVYFPKAGRYQLGLAASTPTDVFMLNFQDGMKPVVSSYPSSKADETAVEASSDFQIDRAGRYSIYIRSFTPAKKPNASTFVLSWKFNNASDWTQIPSDNFTCSGRFLNLLKSVSDPFALAKSITASRSRSVENLNSSPEMKEKEATIAQFQEKLKKLEEEKTELKEKLEHNEEDLRIVQGQINDLIQVIQDIKNKIRRELTRLLNEGKCIIKSEIRPQYLAPDSNNMYLFLKTVSEDQAQ